MERATSGRHKTDYILLFVGIVLVLVPLVFVVIEPAHFEQASYFLRVITSLGGALIGSAIPGILEIRIPGIRAAGGLGVLVLLYQFNPPAALNSAIHKPPDITFQIEDGVDRPSGNYLIAPVTELEQCEALCRGNNACLGFVIRKPGFEPHGCYLKSYLDTPVKSECCTTGVAKGRD